MTAEYKLYPGCVIQNRLPFLETSCRFVLDKFGIKASDAEFNCCPNPVGIQYTDLKTWWTLGARNLALAEKENKNILSLCNGCFQTLHLVNQELKHDEIKRKEVNEILTKINKEFKGTVDVKHFVRVLLEDVGIDTIKKAVTKPLTGLKVACHAGCHYSRPSKIVQGDDPLKPQDLRKLVEATGATVVDYGTEIICCGNSVRNTEERLGDMMVKSKIDSAMRAGADCMAVNCPACFQAFDSDQAKLKKYAVEGQEYQFPVFYITELLAMAMGKTPKDFGMEFHRMKGKEALAKLGFT
jgi:heterodisulfide reductase subunit B